MLAEPCNLTPAPLLSLLARENQPRLLYGTCYTYPTFEERKYFSYAHASLINHPLTRVCFIRSLHNYWSMFCDPGLLVHYGDE